MTLTIVLVGFIVVCLVVWAVARQRNRRPIQMRSLTPTEVEHARVLRSSDRPSAMRYVREHTGMGLVAAREYVDSL